MAEDEDITEMTTTAEDVSAADGGDEIEKDAIEKDEMEEVEGMIKQASKELEEVAEENQKLLDALGNKKDEAEAEDEVEDVDTGSIFQFDPKVDSAVMRELEDCERQAKETAGVISKIKKRVSELMTKEKMSEAEAKELEAMNKELRSQMIIFEEKTRRIQQLITQANLFDNYKAPSPPLPGDEDKLPKVIVCGQTEDNMPKIILCADKKKESTGFSLGLTQKMVMPCTARGSRPPTASAQNGMIPSMGGMPPPQMGYGMPQQNMMMGGMGMMPQQPMGIQQQYGMPQPQMRMPQPQMGMPQQQMGMPQQQMGMQQPQMGMQQPQMGMQQPRQPMGMPQQPMGMPQQGYNRMSRSMNVVPQLAQTLNQSFCMQEKLAAENQNLEGARYRLQSDLATKDTTVECLQKQLDSLKQEMRMVCKENQFLNEKLAGPQGDRSCASSTKSSKKMGGCEKGNRGSIETRMRNYSETTENLEKQLACMEKNVRMIQNDLCSVQKERQHLEHHKKQMACPPEPQHVCNQQQKSGSQNQQLCELKEQYKCLQDDFKGKLCEVAGLRTDNERFKTCIAKMEEEKQLAEDKVKVLEEELRKLSGKGTGTPKENIMELEQELKVARQRFREAQDELDELRALIEDQQTQLDDYRNKYIVAQQEVEEQRRQIDMMEMENNRISEQVNLEIQRVKNQFQEKLQELTPLPEVLKCTQVKLQEAQQMHMLAERNNEAMARELQLYKDKIAEITKELNELKGSDDSEEMAENTARLRKELEDLKTELACCRVSLTEMKELAEEKDKLAQSKLHEIAQLQAQLESVREESARQVARTKDRCETVRRSMQNQISDLERQLAQSRATARTAQKDRDEIRQKMQAQINNLNENFEDAQMRIRNLQGHVNFLKTSYNTVFTMDEKKQEVDPCNCGMDDF
ncbi:unnamed protein product [Brassicogethes aeneus]|uniref:Uncharacterized protein n=1 Tax=Brassicogethes aeneus TaxID=1431903 RepID=A0A9P0ARH8_BRAAE|nr:unnamed protein product [Brassicogethes aeneus]